MDDISNAAGVCLACSYKCHENHNLVELYTKRNFRCDCGTKKLPNVKCHLTTSKDEKLPINRDNVYNHNFQGLYCSCNRPYPDPENDTGSDGDIMAQCTICEDWYHYAHLNTKIPDKADDFDLICELCLKKNKFLQCYYKYSKRSEKVTSEETSSETDVKLRSTLEKSISEILNIDSTVACEESAPKRTKLEENSEIECTLPNFKNEYNEGSLFFPSNWRDFICRCSKCKQIYLDEKLEFLLDPDDSQRLYEEKGFKKVDTALESTIQNLSSTNRVALVETIHEFQNMAGKLKDFLIPFMQSKKVVTQDDINRFFDEMKKQRSASKTTQPSTFCR